MKDRSINEAMWDALHILGAAHAPVTRLERVALESLADTSERVAAVFAGVRGRPLSGAEVHVLVRVVQAALLSAGRDGNAHPPQADTPPGGIRR